LASRLQLGMGRGAVGGLLRSEIFRGYELAAVPTSMPARVMANPSRSRYPSAISGIHRRSCAGGRPPRNAVGRAPSPVRGFLARTDRSGTGWTVICQSGNGFSAGSPQTRVPPADAASNIMMLSAQAIDCPSGTTPFSSSTPRLGSATSRHARNSAGRAASSSCATRMGPDEGHAGTGGGITAGTAAMLYVDESSPAAVALYRRHGFEIWSTDVM
jgi:hypothetical protein